MERKIKIFSFAAVLMLAVSVIGCKHNINNKPEAFTVTFNVDGGGGTLTAKIGETEIKSGNEVESNKTVTFTATPTAGFKVKGWTLDGKPITEVGTKTEYKLTVTKACTIKVSFLAGNATYTVKHYQERAEGGYPAEPTETENVNGTVGTNAAYTPKTGGAYEGFTCNSVLTKVNGVVQQTGTIAADNSTVVELFYERNTVSLTFRLAGGNIEGKTDDIVKTGKYGTPFTAPADPAKATGVFKGWKPALPSPLLFPASNAEHTAEWTPKALLTLEAGKNTVKVKAKTADGSAIKVEGCNVNELANEAETTLTVTNPERKLALIGELIELDCRGEETPGGNRPLIALDASGCTALQKLNCQYNHITALDVQGLNALQELNCDSNKLSTLNVQGCTALQKLDCSGNELTALNVQGLTKLQELICNVNELTALDVSGCTVLQKLNCARNKLTALDVSGLTALQELYCNSNQIPELNVQGLTELQKLWCNGNQLTSLDVQGCTSLQELYCRGNQLTTLNVQGCTSLKTLECYKNKLNADVFTKLFNDLPTHEVSDGAKAILYVTPSIYTPQTNDGNCTNFTQPDPLKKAFEDAKNIKHWKMQKIGEIGFPQDI